MNKTIIIGIGGTGLKAIREIRRLIAERYEQGLKSPEIASVKFIYIDTDFDEINRHNWSVLGKDIKLSSGEKILLTGDGLQEIVDNIENYEYIKKWFPNLKDYIGEAGPGAKGYRPYGKLIYEYSGNKQKVKDTIFKSYNALNANFNSGDWNFYLICGLSGGTGSGMFIPFSNDLVNDWQLHTRDESKTRFYSFFILPTLTTIKPHDRYYANTFAALKELNYYPLLPKKEQLGYTNCYLLEPRNNSNIILNLDKLPILIAQRIFLGLQIKQGNGVSRIQSLMDNKSATSETDKITGEKHAFSFSTFGISTISYPKEIVYRCLAYKIASEVVSSWKNQTDYPKDVNQQVRNELENIRLSEFHCLGDSDAFESKLQTTYKIQIEDDVDLKLKNTNSRKDLVYHATNSRQEIEDTFRNRGIIPYYKQLEDDLQGAIEEATRLTKEKVTSLLVNSKYGVEFCNRFLEELVKVLEEFQNKFNEESGTDINLNLTRTNFNNSINFVSKGGSGIFGFQKDKELVIYALKDYLKTSAGLHANRYGIKFTTGVLSNIKIIQSDLNTVKTIIQNLDESLQGKVKSFLKDLRRETQENGEIIFNEDGLEKLLKGLDHQKFKNEIQQHLALKKGQKKLDLITLLQSSKLDDLFYGIAYDWICSTNVSTNIGNINLYDKFVNQFPDKDNRQNIINNVESLSSPFLVFSRPQIELDRKVTPDSRSIIAIPNFNDNQGQVTSNNDRPNHLIIEEDIDAMLVDEKIETEEKDRITFIQEIKGFPLRFIKSLEFLQEEYEKYSIEEYRESLHTDKRIVSTLYNLYLLTAEQKQEKIKAEEVFVFARASKWICSNNNQDTNKNEVRFDYKDDQEEFFGTEKCVFGYTWDSAFSAFEEDAIATNSHNSQIRKARLLLSKKYEQKCEDSRRKFSTQEEIKNELKLLLNVLLQEYGSDDHPIYKKYRIIINDRILKNLRNEE